MRMKGLTERERDRVRAVPTALADGRFERGEPQRDRQTLRRAARMEYDVGIGPGRIRVREGNAECVGDRASVRIRVDQLDVAPGHASQDPGRETSDASAANDGNAIAGGSSRVP